MTVNIFTPETITLNFHVTYHVSSPIWDKQPLFQSQNRQNGDNAEKSIKNDAEVYKMWPGRKYYNDWIYLI